MDHLYLPYSTQGNSHPVAEMIYSFHMPLFFFISGYLCEITHKIGRVTIQSLWAYSIGKFIYKIPYLRLIMYGKK